MRLVILIVLLLSVIEISKSNFVWLISCHDNTECSHLKNAKCLNGFCNCGKKYSVCEDLKIIGRECDDLRTCNLSYSECGENGKCVCKEGFMPGSDLMSCLRVGGQVAGTNVTEDKLGNEKSLSQSISGQGCVFLLLIIFSVLFL
ncbi:uncharacterized protein LOC103313909 [Tribolium castaneum]|uniref:EB domain-containing protein n=1 Tax=Tribolium castaneum TaxID=7070 RepID=D6WVT5_TRICA|nr:PREDICTED: uncharacterized protein LOC103313909 [Tribolium castaneum]EFA08245.2 hypothetical protein TcasGA2_TC005873 [Tribolium castaneum]|eukprot:XP_008196627.1 PREDICTED: uncharacterized protein LOC103313909 [Tribolium castaneum]